MSPGHQSDVKQNGTLVIMMGRFVYLFTLCGFWLLFLRRETCAYNFEIGYEYHYEYKADSVVLADFQVLTIVKVKYSVQLSFCIVYSKCICRQCKN